LGSNATRARRKKNRDNKEQTYKDTRGVQQSGYQGNGSKTYPCGECITSILLQHAEMNQPKETGKQYPEKLFKITRLHSLVKNVATELVF
jgi:hypothetical protein